MPTAAATILIVEDMVILRELIAAALSAVGYRTVGAGGAREAMEAARTSPPDLVLLEPGTANGGGLQFLRAMRADPKLAATPVIVLTAVADRKYVWEVGRLGAQEYVLKSHTPVKDLLSRVRRYAVKQGRPAKDAKAPESATQAPSSAAAVAKSSATKVLPTPVTPGPAAKAVVLTEPKNLLTREQCLQRAERALQAKTLSGVVAQVIAMAANARSDASQLAEMIARDVMLSAKVLQAANSAAYASNRGMISNISEAVRRIGCSAIRNIASAVGVFEAMPDTGPDGFNPIRCWQHSFAVARLCEQLAARQYPEQTGTAYLAGLCHDLGDILFRSHFGAEYAQVLEVHETSAIPLRQLERDMLGITQEELSKTIVRCLDLPQAIRGPIEEMHAEGELHQPLGRVLQLADRYANGMLLAAGGASPLVPLSRSDCRKAAGEESPAIPDADTFRSEILALTSMLARLNDAEARRLNEPLYPRGQTKLWLTREAGLSAFDPIAAALTALADVRVSDELPSPGEAAGCGGLIVVARSPAAAGLDAAAIGQAAAQTVADAEPLSVLWLAGPVAMNPASQVSGPLLPRPWPISIDELVSFVGQCITKTSDRHAAKAA